MFLKLSAQPISEFKIKNESNSRERTKMLDLLRNEVRNAYDIEVVFDVNHFKVSGNYGYIESTAKRKDNKELVLSEDGGDCCQVGALFYKNNGIWEVAQSGIFPTDVWCYCITKSYPKANLAIFSELAKNSSAHCD
jgi:hypothetical protein